MKKAISIILAVLLIIFSFAACTPKDTGKPASSDSSDASDKDEAKSDKKSKKVKWKDNVNETFASITECKYGKISSAEFGTVANVKVIDNDFEDFKKYIDDLKKDGFEYYQIGNIAENITESNGQSSWRGSKDGVFVFVIFSSDDSENFEAFGCNIQIFGYDYDPWKDVNKETTTEKKSKKDKSKTDSESKSEKETKKAETTKAKD